MALTGTAALNRSQASAEAETGSIDSPVKECQGWIGVRAVYDDPWATPITNCQVRIEVSGSIVADGPRTKGLSAFGKEDGQPHADVRAELGGYLQRGVKLGPAVIALVPHGDPELANALEKQIYNQLSAFETSMRERLQPWTTEWSKQGWWSVPAAKRRGQLRGLGLWWEGEVEFWASASELGKATWGGIKSGASKLATWYDDLPWYEKALPLPLLLGVELGKLALAGGVELWDRRDQLMNLLKAFSKGSIAAIEAALAALVDLPGELGKLVKALVKDSADWVQNMIEVARETDVLKRATNTIMAVVMMMTPNFWAEGIGMVEGYLLPEVLITIVLILIGELCAAAGASALVARIAGMLSRFRQALGAAGKTGEVLTTLFSKLDESAKLIGNLSKALRNRIKETQQGITNSINQIRRKSSTPTWPKFKTRISKTGADTGINETTLNGKTYSVNSQHAWNGSHKSGIRPNEIGVSKNHLESAIVHDLDTFAQKGGTIPRISNVNFDRTITIANKSVGYRSVSLPSGETRITTYWINP